MRSDLVSARYNNDTAVQGGSYHGSVLRSSRADCLVNLLATAFIPKSKQNIMYFW